MGQLLLATTTRGCTRRDFKDFHVQSPSTAVLPRGFEGKLGHGLAPVRFRTLSREGKGTQVRLRNAIFKVAVRKCNAVGPIAKHLGDGSRHVGVMSFPAKVVGLHSASRREAGSPQDECRRWPSFDELQDEAREKIRGGPVPEVGWMWRPVKNNDIVPRKCGLVPRSISPKFRIFAAKNNQSGWDVLGRRPPCRFAALPSLVGRAKVLRQQPCNRDIAVAKVGRRAGDEGRGEGAAHGRTHHHHPGPRRKPKPVEQGAQELIAPNFAARAGPLIEGLSSGGGERRRGPVSRHVRSDYRVALRAELVEHPDYLPRAGSKRGAVAENHRPGLLT
mmetsp:Transcript_57920/g.131247  ORF Transcript_57920/g.131247 Transcript_57920/m.131247 type:complete len:332 (-) Transcript_57920:304-1299(-)